MRRTLLAGFALLALMGCQAIEDREVIRPLPPETGPKTTYTDLLLRARSQADVAVRRAYADIWADVEDVAKSLEQTAKLLPTAPEGPKDKSDLGKLSSAIGEDAKKLSDGARAIVNLTGSNKDKKQKEIDELLRTISRNVRTLRAAN